MDKIIKKDKNNKVIVQNHNFMIKIYFENEEQLQIAYNDLKYIYNCEVDKQMDKLLNKPFRLPKGSGKKFGVYVKSKDTGKIVKITFGDPNLSIKRDDPERKASFRARHNCEDAKDKTSPKYWSCRMWSSKPVSKIVQYIMIIKITYYNNILIFKSNNRTYEGNKELYKYSRWLYK